MAGLVCFFRDGADILHFARVTIMHVVETRTGKSEPAGKEGWYLHRRGRNHDIYRRSTPLQRQSILPRHRIVSPGVARQIRDRRMGGIL